MADSRVRLIPLDYSPRTGGTAWALKEGRRALMFDFGANLELQGSLLRGTRLPDRGGIDDRVELGLLPRLDLYRDDLQLDANLFDGSGDLGIQALLLGHGHFDHFGNMFALHPEIEAHMTSITAAYLWTHQTCSQGLSSETTHIFERSPHPSEKQILWKPRYAEPKPRTIKLVDGEPSEPLSALFRATGTDEGLMASDQSAAGLKYEALPIDHSVLGGCSYIVWTSAGPCSMLTDLRRHGAMASDTEAAIGRCAQVGLRAALVDGTCLGRDDAPTWTESDCLERIHAIVRGAGRRLIVASFGHRHVERLMSFLRVARASKRRLVVSPRQMTLIEAVAAATSSEELSDVDGLSIYDPPRASRRSWHTQLRKRRHAMLVTPEEIRKAPHLFIVSHEIGVTSEWLEYQPHGAIFVHSSSAAYDDESRGRHASLEEWLRIFRMKAEGISFGPRGCEYDPILNPSGHLQRAHLHEMVHEIRPEILVPIHTSQPDLFRDFLPRGTRLAIPKAGQSIWL